MTPIRIKYKCDNGGMWHDHCLTEEEISWHDGILAAETANECGNGAMKKILGKYFTWYMGVKEAIVQLQRHHDGKEVSVVYVKRHPFPNCCVDDREFILPFSELIAPLIRCPLKTINRQKHKKDNSAHGGEGIVVDKDDAVKGTCDPSTKKMPTTQNQVQSPDTNLDYNDNIAICTDENDTHDDRRHFPLHQLYKSHCAFRVTKLNSKK
jgi:hypothetical protein